ncbi:MAG: hypothetical protein AAFO94_08080 [Bacteroidota bacterium]
MKKCYTVLSCLFLMACVQSGFAQNIVTSVKQNSNTQYEEILSELHLMPDQKAAMKTNDENFRKKLSSTFDLSGDDDAAMQKELEKIQAAYEKELKNILTAHQYKTYHALMEQARQEQGRMF